MDGLTLQTLRHSAVHFGLWRDGRRFRWSSLSWPCFPHQARQGIQVWHWSSIGFVGVFAIFSLMGEQIGPAAQAIVERTGLSSGAVGPDGHRWQSGSPIAPFAIVLTIINLGVLAAKWTTDHDIDIWNYWHSALPVALFMSLRAILRSASSGLGSLRSYYQEPTG